MKRLIVLAYTFNAPTWGRFCFYSYFFVSRGLFMISIFGAKKKVFENRSAAYLWYVSSGSAEKSFCSPKDEIMESPSV